MRVQMYLPAERCLYMQDAKFAELFDLPIVGTGTTLRERAGEQMLGVRGVVLYSPEDPLMAESLEQPAVGDGWLFVYVDSCEELLDEWQVEWQTDDLGTRVGSIRDSDLIGVISGPVDRIVFSDLARSWPAGTRKRRDRTRWFRGRPRS